MVSRREEVEVTWLLKASAPMQSRVSGRAHNFFVLTQRQVWISLMYVCCLSLCPHLFIFFQIRIHWPGFVFAKHGYPLWVKVPREVNSKGFHTATNRIFLAYKHTQRTTYGWYQLFWSSCGLTTDRLVVASTSVRTLPTRYRTCDSSESVLLAHAWRQRDRCCSRGDPWHPWLPVPSLTAWGRGQPLPATSILAFRWKTGHLQMKSGSVLTGQRFISVARTRPRQKPRYTSLELKALPLHANNREDFHSFSTACLVW